MRKLSGLGIVFVLKTCSLGERVDGLLRSGQEMPTLGCAGTSVSLHKLCLLCGCHRRGLARIVADGKHVELVADIELEHPEGAFQSTKDFTAKHGALVVDEVEDHRLSAEVIS